MDSVPEAAIRVVALTRQGASLAREISRGLAGARCWLPRALAGGDPQERTFDRVATVLGEAFRQGENLVVVMAAGIVVRSIAPLLRGKARDPGVVVVDEAGKFAISLLSGHQGGANQLARRVAQIIKGTPVITTASDLQGLPALDLAAMRTGLTIENPAALSQVQMSLLSGLSLHLVDPDGFLAELAEEHPGRFIRETDLDAALAGGGPGVYAGFRERAWPQDWLALRPKNLVAGVGCHPGAAADEILGFLRDSFREERLSLASLKALASIEARKEEPGLLEAAARLGVEFIWVAKEELQSVAVPTPSPQVVRLVGVESVAEAAALKAGGKALLLTKRKRGNLTLAVAHVGDA